MSHDLLDFTTAVGMQEPSFGSIGLAELTTRPADSFSFMRSPAMRAGGNGAFDWDRAVRFISATVSKRGAIVRQDDGIDDGRYSEVVRNERFSFSSSMQDIFCTFDSVLLMDYV